MTEPHKMLLPEEIKDTKKLQLQSLLTFALELGYKCYWFDQNSFYSEHKGITRISFKTMVDLHNHGSKRCTDLLGFIKKKSPFEFNEYVWARAKAAKIVNRVFLQYSKKESEIICHKHIVSFPYPSYEQLFLKNCKSLGLKSITDEMISELYEE